MEPIQQAFEAWLDEAIPTWRTMTTEPKGQAMIEGRKR
jgi:hypothetical protein